MINYFCSTSLGRGWRLGFLGTLHMDVFKQRLESEYEANIIFTAPTVSYIIHYRNGEEKVINSMEAFPNVEDMTRVSSIKEPYVLATIISPEESLGKILSLCLERRAVQKDMSFLDAKRTLIKFRIPLSEIVIDFFDEIKSISSGYAR
jgi:translation elongation factor EF-4